MLTVYLNGGKRNHALNYIIKESDYESLYACFWNGYNKRFYL